MDPLAKFPPLIERAARIHCKNIGLDPDEGPVVAHKTITGMTMKVENWKMVAKDLLDLSMMIGALNQARREETPKQGEKSGDINTRE